MQISCYMRNEQNILTVGSPGGKTRWNICCHLSLSLSIGFGILTNLAKGATWTLAEDAWAVALGGLELGTGESGTGNGVGCIGRREPEGASFFITAGRLGSSSLGEGGEVPSRSRDIKEAVLCMPPASMARKLDLEGERSRIGGEVEDLEGDWTSADV